MRGFPRLRTASRWAGLTLLLAGLLSAGVLAAWEYFDRQELRRVAQDVTGAIADPGEKVTALNAWVYRNKGFARNRHYFGLARLGPTPNQVMAHGGDCADKSRLLSAMLETLGMRSSLAMLYPCAECGPVHTVVMAEIGPYRTLVDPVFDITFPNSSNGYFSVEDLVKDPWLLSARLQALRAERGPQDKIIWYRESNHRYDYLTTINWRASALTRAAAQGLQWVGIEPRYVFRPMWLENPKRALTYGALALAALGAAVSMAAWRRRS